MDKQKKRIVEGENMLVVDLGFSSAKFLRNDTKGTITSCFRKIKGTEGHSFRGDNYLVGERALLQTGSQYLRTTDELTEFYPLFAGIAAKKSDVNDKGTLVVGLPYDFWKTEMFKEKRGVSNAIGQLKDSLKLIKINEKEYGFEKVLIFPQGLGGIKDYLWQSGASSGNILAIDIGFNTVIATLYSADEREILAGKTFYKRGLHDMVVNLLMPEITSHIGGKTLTPLEINHLVQTRSVQVGFDLIDIKPEIDAAASTYVRDLLGMIIGDLKAHSGVISFDTVILFGGGARLLQDKLEAKKVRIVILPEPEFANARGFAVKAQEIHREE